jgi:ribosome assembly protein 4
VTRTGPWDHTDTSFFTREKMFDAACKRYAAFVASTPEKGEMLASASDDFTLILWSPTTSKTPVTRMTGHQQPVNQISFSPDGHTLASASFDKSVKLWNGHSGAFSTTLRGHVGSV